MASIVNILGIPKDFSRKDLDEYFRYIFVFVFLSEMLYKISVILFCS